MTSESLFPSATGNITNMWIFYIWMPLFSSVDLPNLCWSNLRQRLGMKKHRPIMASEHLSAENMHLWSQRRPPYVSIMSSPNGLQLANQDLSEMSPGRIGAPISLLETLWKWHHPSRKKSFLLKNQWTQSAFNGSPFSPCALAVLIPTHEAICTWPRVKTPQKRTGSDWNITLIESGKIIGSKFHHTWGSSWLWPFLGEHDPCENPKKKTKPNNCKQFHNSHPCTSVMFTITLAKPGWGVSHSSLPPTCWVARGWCSSACGSVASHCAFQRPSSLAHLLGCVDETLLAPGQVAAVTRSKWTIH